MSDFRKSKSSSSGAVNIIKKGSKYDKDAKDIRDSKMGVINNYTKAKGLKEVPDNVKKDISDDSDDWATGEIRRGDIKYVKDMMRRNERESAKEHKKASTGRKDFPFFKHTTKGK